jgi:DNA-directed RNA polymerase subunit F
MSKREISETKYTLPQVKQTLEAVGEENLDQFQRRTLDYVSKFVKVDAAGAEFLMEKLVKEYGLDERRRTSHLLSWRTKNNRNPKARCHREHIE